jgi:hypothetical protein
MGGGGGAREGRVEPAPKVGLLEGGEAGGGGGAAGAGGWLSGGTGRVADGGRGAGAGGTGARGGCSSRAALGFVSVEGRVNQSASAHRATKGMTIHRMRERLDTPRA